ncbi:uncharacterized protein LOC109811839 [Cajanus cajan]|uniref:uncharacterized protein LOC109811839 n=1 Tax=Cajanus cajan TaxID=3821 RepID=UPI00098DA59A|nr:uncharacterized protein LOC109811839 [Cajanus cajan]
MEFNNSVIQNQSTPVSNALPTVTYASASSSQGSCVSMDVEEVSQHELEKQQIQRKEEIRREIIAGEMARRRELEEEVRRETAFEKSFGIPTQRPEGISFQPPVSTFFNPIMNIPHPHVAKPDVVPHEAKRKAVTPLLIDDIEKHSSFSFQMIQPSDAYWSCSLCQITTTSERNLEDHRQGKKHKAKEASMSTPKIGLDGRSKNQILQPCLTLTDTCILKSAKEDQVALESQDLGGLDNKNETATEQKAGKTKALTPKKKFKFWCAFCDFKAYSETDMENHKTGEMHLAKMKEFSKNNGYHVEW